MKRRTRFTTAILTLVAVLFAPLATAFTACDRGGDMEAMQVAAARELPVAAAQVDAPMDPAACERHCLQGNASFQPGANVNAPLAIPAIAPLRIAPLHAVTLRAPSFDSPFAVAAGPSPPLIRYTVLRH